MRLKIAFRESHAGRQIRNNETRKTTIQVHIRKDERREMEEMTRWESNDKLKSTRRDINLKPLRKEKKEGRGILEV